MAESDFDELMTSTIVVSTGAPTRDVHGVETWSGNGSTYRGRYVEKRDDVRTGQGNVVAQSGIAWVSSTVAFTTEARVMIDGVAKPVVAVERFPDESGAHHVRLRLGF